MAFALKLYANYYKFNPTQRGYETYIESFLESPLHYDIILYDGYVSVYFKIYDIIARN